MLVSPEAASRQTEEQSRDANSQTCLRAGAKPRVIPTHTDCAVLDGLVRVCRHRKQAVDGITVGRDDDLELSVAGGFHGDDSVGKAKATSIRLGAIESLSVHFGLDIQRIPRDTHEGEVCLFSLRSRVLERYRVRPIDKLRCCEAGKKTVSGTLWIILIREAIEENVVDEIPSSRGKRNRGIDALGLAHSEQDIFGLVIGREIEEPKRNPDS